MNIIGKLLKRVFQSFVSWPAWYYRDYIASFAAIAAPLTDLTRKGQLNFVKGGEDYEKAFNTLGEALLKRPIF